jgi:hypothetical protein
MLLPYTLAGFDLTTHKLPSPRWQSETIPHTQPGHQKWFHVGTKKYVRQHYKARINAMPSWRFLCNRGKHVPGVLQARDGSRALHMPRLQGIHRPKHSVLLEQLGGLRHCRFITSLKPIVQGCQIFLGSTYQNGDTKLPQNIPMVIKWPSNIPTISTPRPQKCIKFGIFVVKI